MKVIPLLCASLLVTVSAFAHHDKDKGDGDGLKNTVVLIIRHAEKPKNGDELAPAGQERAQAYVNYFLNFKDGTQPLKINYLFAAADSKGSHRPRLTVTPFSEASGLRIDTSFKEKEYGNLASALRSHHYGDVILICWHHGTIPKLVEALGGDSGQMFPKGKWPGSEYGGIVLLRYDGDGHVTQGTFTNEHLMPDDNDKVSDDNSSDDDDNK